MSDLFDPFNPLPFGFAQGSLPRIQAPLTIATRSWGQLLPESGARQASAVMALFIPDPHPHSTAALVLTRRSTTVRSHKGQVSFAGGRRDSTDANPAATALRELEEELGVQAARVEVRGMLEPIIGIDGTAIYPVIGAAAISRGELKPSESEVAEIITVPWPCVALSQARSFEFNLYGNWRSSWLFQTPSGGIWGLTALIIHRAGLD